MLALEVVCQIIWRMCVLCFLSGCVPKDLHLREAHESHLGLPSSFFVVGNDLKDLDGNCIVEDTQRGTLIRVGSTEVGFSSGKRRQHKINSELSCPVGKQRRFLQIHPDKSGNDKACGSMKGFFQSLKQRVGLGVKRSQTAELVCLFQWDAEEEQELEQLHWSSSRPGSMTNSKGKHLTHLFQEARSVCINPSVNVTQNPTAEWELDWF